MSDSRYYYVSDVMAFTLDEIILHGMKNGANMVNGMPWSFKFCGQPVTHETDDLYLIGGNGTHMTHKDMLVINVKEADIITVLPMSVFTKTYEDRD